MFLALKKSIAPPVQLSRKRQLFSCRELPSYPRVALPLSKYYSAPRMFLAVMQVNFTAILNKHADLILTQEGCYRICSKSVLNVHIISHL